MSCIGPHPCCAISTAFSPRRMGSRVDESASCAVDGGAEFVMYRCLAVAVQLRDDLRQCQEEVARKNKLLAQLARYDPAVSTSLASFS